MAEPSSKQKGWFDDRENSELDIVYGEGGASDPVAVASINGSQFALILTLVPKSSDGAALGTSALQWSDLFLASGAVINFNNSDITLTHAANLLTFAGGNLSMGNDALILRDVNAGLTASTTKTQGQGALTAEVNEVATVANTNDTVTLPTAVTGLKIIVINNGTNDLQIFPASGDNLGAGANSSTSIEQGETATFVAYDATNWNISATTQLRHAEMTDNENTDAYVITEQDNEQAYHSNGFVVGDIGVGGRKDRRYLILSVGDYGLNLEVPSIYSRREIRVAYDIVNSQKVIIRSCNLNIDPRCCPVRY